MVHYFLRRLLYMIVTVLAVSVVAFVLIQLPPGDYLDTYMAQLKAQGTQVSQADIAALTVQYGLDQPATVQYFRWIWDIVTQGDFGRSFEWNAPVKDLLWDLNIYDDQARAQEWAIVLADEDDVERLRKVLILKLVLALNENMPLTLQAFRPGVQILFPTREDMRNRYHLIDREAAQLFYETKYPYQVTQRVLNATLSRVKEELGIKEEAGLPEVEKP